MKIFKNMKVMVLLIMLLTTPLLMGISSTGEAIPFFEGFSAEALYVLVVSGLIGLSQGLWPGISVFNLVKSKLNMEDRAAHYAVLLMSGILAAAALFVTGEINFSGMSLTLQNLLSLGGIIYTMSQIGYQSFKAANPKK